MKRLGAASIICLQLGAGCATGGDQPSFASLSTTTMQFAGSYHVPVDDSLADAATFSVDRFDWRANHGQATLSYRLPEALVGGELVIEFHGSIAADQTELLLTGEVGTGRCIPVDNQIECHHVFSGLGPLPISEQQVEDQATVEYGGDASDRLEVSQLFGSDPIGIAVIDLSRPIVDE